MGIKELWPFLNPYCVRKPLYELQGKTVAIDLAGWICESLCVVDYEVQAKFYLRNLFFRTCYLLLSGITPVFVLEGTAPALKHQMITKRNQIQFRGARPRKNTQEASSQKPAKGRTRFNYVLKQCEELIRSMGLQCVQGVGEAEAFCAHLNAARLVDGVISQDSDCFAYGARRVFRNFSLSMQGTAGSIGGSIDIYDLDFVQKSVDFGRNKIVVMALLCGCDYCPEGVGGVGRDAVHKLFTIYSEHEILDKIRLWRKNNTKYTELELKVNDKKVCVSCGHNGRVQIHTKSGCNQCKMSVGCDASIWKEKRLAIKAELQVRKKAMLLEDFPSQEVIDEFMQEPIDMSPLQLDWSQPNIVKFVKMMGKCLQWEEIYCLQKILPLLTRWQLHHINSGSDSASLRGCVYPDFIKKKRTPKGVPSYEIIWKDTKSCFDTLIPVEQLQVYLTTTKEKTETEALEMLWTTIEPKDLVEQAYPELVEKFEESKAKGKSKKTKKNDDPNKVTKTRATKTTKAVDEKAPKERTKKARTVSKKKTDEKLQAIDVFFRKEQTGAYASPKIKTSSKPMNLSAFSLDFMESYQDDNMNLSEIINDMVTRPPNITDFNGKRLRFDEITVKGSESSEMDDEENAEADDSFDEFDLIVMRKNTKKSTHLLDDKITNSSTPVLKGNYRRVSMRRSIGMDSIRQSIGMDASSSAKSTVISTSFFAVNADDELDLFEKSIDFRNMQDSEDESQDDSPELDEVNQYDTFDRLVGLA